MPGAGLNVAGLGLLLAGGILSYSGVNDPEGGPVGVLRALLKGETPRPGSQTVTATVETAPNVGVGDPFTLQNGPVPAYVGKVVEVAMSYVGTPYVLGGASRKGIDCSGLVMVAYRDGAGIKLPHRATLQAARGRRVAREDCRAGDLVAWGVPGNYPHIALAISNTQVMGAWTYGVKAHVGPIDQKAVPGFGYPDIIRLGAS